MASAQKKISEIYKYHGESHCADTLTLPPPPTEHLKYGIRRVHVISFTSQAIGLQLDILINNLFLFYMT